VNYFGNDSVGSDKKYYAAPLDKIE